MGILIKGCADCELIPSHREMFNVMHASETEGKVFPGGCADSELLPTADTRVHVPHLRTLGVSGCELPQLPWRIFGLSTVSLGPV